MVLLAAELTKTMPLPLGTAAVPAALVPMRLPSTWLRWEAAPLIRMPSVVSRIEFTVMTAARARRYSSVSSRG